MKARTAVLILIAFFAGFGSSVGAAKLSYIIWSSEISHAVQQCEISKTLGEYQGDGLTLDDRVALAKGSRVLRGYCEQLHDMAVMVSQFSFASASDIELLYMTLSSRALKDE